MKNQTNNKFSDRRSTAAAAKASLLSAFQAAKTAAEPSRLVKQAERVSLVEAREARQLERKRLKLEERVHLETKIAEEQAAVEIAATMEAEARKLEKNALIARVIEDQATSKIERDRRYAQRKARKA